MKYYLCLKTNNPHHNHEIHTNRCQYFPSNEGIYLGEFEICHPALRMAKSLGYSNVDGCADCCRDCNDG